MSERTAIHGRTPALVRRLAGMLLLCNLLTPSWAATVSPQLYQRLQHASQLAERSPAEAIALLRTYQPAPGRDRAQWQRFLGQYYTRAGEYRQAVGQLAPAVGSGELAADDLRDTLQLLGEIQLHLGEHASAERHLEQALQLCHRGCDRILLHLGYASYYQQRYRQALNWLARQTSASDASLLLALNCQQQLKAWPQAITLQQQLLQRQPQTLGYWRNLAYLYVSNKQPKTAAAVLLLAEQAGALTHAQDWRWLAGQLAAAGAPGYALRLLDQAVAGQHLDVTPAVQQDRLNYARLAGDHRRAAELYRQRYAEEGRLEDRLGLLAELQTFSTQQALALLSDWPAQHKTTALWLQQLNLLVQIGAWREATAIAKQMARQTDPQMVSQANSWLEFIEQRQRLLQ